MNEKEIKTIGQVLQEMGDVPAQLNTPIRTALFRPRKKIKAWKRR